MRTKLATATRWAAQRPRRDQQGIALQTVIVIVVMLVIAGGVSGVLLSRGSEVIGDLEAADTNFAEITSEEECIDAARALTRISGLGLQSAGANQAGVAWTPGSQQCVVSSASATFATGEFTRRACEQYRNPDGTRATFTGTPGTSQTTCTTKA